MHLHMWEETKAVPEENAKLSCSYYEVRKYLLQLCKSLLQVDIEKREHTFQKNGRQIFFFENWIQFTRKPIRG